MKNSINYAATLLTLLSFVTTGIAAQNIEENNIETEKTADIEKEKVTERTESGTKKGLYFDADFRIRPEVKQSRNFKSDTGTSEFVGQRARIGVGHIFDDGSELYIRFQDARIWGGQSGSAVAIDTARTYRSQDDEKYHEKAVDVREAYFNLKRVFNTSLDLQAGRQILAYGNQRLVGHLDWFNTGRSFDALRLKAESDENGLHVFSAITTEADASEAFNLATETDHSEETWFSGIYNSYKGLPGLKLDTYLLSRDNFIKHSEIHTAGFLVQSENKKPAGIDYSLEGAYQFGIHNSLDVSAYAAALTGGYTLPLGSSFLRFGAEIDYASGDADAGDETYGTFTNLYHTNHLHYGVADLVSWRNLTAGSLKVKLFQPKKFGVELAYWYAARATENDSWYAVSGASTSLAAGSESRSLFHEIDLTFKYHARDYLVVAGGYAYAIRGGVLTDSANTGNYDSDYQFAYLMSMLKFKS